MRCRWLRKGYVRMGSSQDLQVRGKLRYRCHINYRCRADAGAAESVSAAE